MNIVLAESNRLRFCQAGFVAAMAVCAVSRAEPTCPNWVETSSGSAFNLAAVIADAGSPQSALDKVRSALAKVNQGGGCTIFANKRACDETLTLARKAIVALESCTAESSGRAQHGSLQ
jgi:hypothetical protein